MLSDIDERQPDLDTPALIILRISVLTLRRSILMSKEIRKRLKSVLRSDSDFDAFCIDHFRPIYDKFSQGMDRTAKMNLLLTTAEPVEIMQALDEEHKGVQQITPVTEPARRVDFQKKSIARTERGKPSKHAAATSLSQVTPTQIAADILGRPPYQKKAAIQAFLGLRVKWELALMGVTEAPSIRAILASVTGQQHHDPDPELDILAHYKKGEEWSLKALATRNGLLRNSISIEFATTAQKCPKIKTALAGAKLIVVGTIEEIRDLGFLGIVLSDIELDVE